MSNPFKKRTTLWGKKEKKSLKDEFGRIATALKSHESSCDGHKLHPELGKLLEVFRSPYDDLKGPYVAAKKDLKALSKRLEKPPEFFENRKSVTKNPFFFILPKHPFLWSTFEKKYFKVQAILFPAETLKKFENSLKKSSFRLA